ncbi:hypothetical protein ACHAWO_002320 [Cyclotella atomus]|uniref:Uncharacterized protein n=1 Tax=Cyclotella atomus TaxID=382360 RepID=A0ABD3Q171_9STRA
MNRRLSILPSRALAPRRAARHLLKPKLAWQQQRPSSEGRHHPAPFPSTKATTTTGDDPNALSRALNNIDAANNGHVVNPGSGSNSSMEERPRYKKTIVSTNPPQSFVSYLSFTRSIIQSLIMFTCRICCCSSAVFPTTINRYKSTMGDAELGRINPSKIYEVKPTMKVSSQWKIMRQHAIEWELAAKIKAFEEIAECKEESIRGGETELMH